MKFKTNFKYGIVLFFILVSSPCYGQLGGPSTDYDAPEELIVSDVNVKGTNAFDEQTVVIFTGLQKGDVIRMPGDKLPNIIKKLWKLNLFQKIDIYTTKLAGDSVEIDIELEDLPQISNIIVKGIDDDEDEYRDVLSAADLKIGIRATENLLINTQNTIKNKYVSEGYYYSDVKVSLLEVDSTKNFEMLISINKKEETAIEEIKIMGNVEIDEDDLLDQIEETNVETWYNFLFVDSRLIEDDFDKDKKSIIEYYRENGYRDAKILSDSVYAYDDESIGIVINVSEGRKYYHRNINWVGNKTLTNEQLDQTLNIRKGDIYDSKQLMTKIRGGEDPSEIDIQTLYLDQGYLFAQVNPIELYAENDSVDLEIQIYEGEKAKISKISVTGNTITHDDVVFRKVRTRPGQLFSKTDIQRSFRELAQTSFFDPEQIGVDPVPDPTNNTVQINYSVVEKSTDQVELQGGFGGVGFFGSVGLTFGNFSIKDFFNPDAWSPVPRGAGETISIRLQQGAFYTNVNLSFVDPYLTSGFRPLSLSTSVFFSQQFATTFGTSFITANDVDESSELQILGIEVGIGKGLTWPDDFFRFRVSAGYRRYTLKDYNISLFNISNGVANNLSFEFTLSRLSSGPNPIYPTQGSDISLSLDITPPYSLFRDIDPETITQSERIKFLEYYKVSTTADFYTTLWDKLVLRNKFQAGFLNSYNDVLGIPPFERFYVGGSGLVQNVADGREIIALRGYPDNSLSSRLGSTAYGKISTELRYPVTTEQQITIFLMTFFEAGRGFDFSSEFQFFDLQRSAGVGVRLFMPIIGTIGFDYGYGFDRIPGTVGVSGWNPHFIIGQSF